MFHAVRQGVDTLADQCNMSWQCVLGSTKPFPHPCALDMCVNTARGDAHSSEHLDALEWG